MDDSYCLLPERISEQFSEIDSDIVMDLAAASPEYTELKAQMEELKRQNLVIGALLEGKGELSFTAEEHEALKEFIRLYMRADNMEREHIYFRGHADGFAYLKKIGAFKTAHSPFISAYKSQKYMQKVDWSNPVGFFHI